MSGCVGKPLASFTEFIQSDFTAAAHLGIEQSECHQTIGQQLVVTWRLPSYMNKKLPLTLRLWVFYGNGTVEKLIYDVHHLSGYRTYRLLNDDYECVQGIVSYKISLCDGDRVILSRQHHLWMEVISLHNV